MRRARSGRSRRSCASRTPALRDATRRSSSRTVATFREGPLDVRHVFDPAFLADTSRARCQPLGPPGGPYVRRRIRVRLGDTLAVLFARADRPTAALQRVEVVRRPLGGGLQEGFTWDSDGDVAEEAVWTADRADAVETGTIPRGSAAPRAIRAIGRLILAAPCTGTRLA